MIQFIKKLKCWFIKLLSKQDKDKDNNENEDKPNNNINIISCKIRYIKEK